MGLPLLALGVSDWLINSHYGVVLGGAETVTRYACLFLIALGGVKLHQAKRTGQFLPLISASLAASALFYVATNTACWVMSSAYPAGWEGWWMALSSGLPGYPPAWTFFRNALAGDLSFTLLFFACVRLGEKVESRQPVPSSAIASAVR